MFVFLLVCLTSKVTTPQDAHRRLELQVYLGSNTLDFSRFRKQSSRPEVESLRVQSFVVS